MADPARLARRLGAARAHLAPQPSVATPAPAGLPLYFFLGEGCGLVEPTGLAVCRGGLVAVTDVGSHGVHLLDPASGRQVAVAGGPGVLCAPSPSQPPPTPPP